MAEARAERLRAAGPALAEKIRRVFARERPATPVDPDAALYDGFLGDGDKRLFAQLRGTPPQLLGRASFAFRDPRLPELLFRYRARNWPETLLPAERADWDAYRHRRLLTDAGLSELTLAQYREDIARLREAHAGIPDRLALLDQLSAWGDQLAAGLGG